jgi:hypothetical protein
MKKIIFLFVLVASSNLIYAQDSDPIVTDRPTQSAAASVVPKGNFLIETGFVNDKIVANYNERTFNALIRFGLTDKIEIRLTQNYIGEEIGNVKSSGFSPTTIGTKVYLASEESGFADMSVIGQVSIPTGAFGSPMASYELRFNFQNSINNNLSLGYNLGAIVSDEQLFLLYTAVLGVSIDEKWTVFAEPFAFIGESFDQRFNAGVIFLQSNNIQFDVSFGIGLSRVAPDSFIGFGAAIGF